VELASSAKTDKPLGRPRFVISPSSYHSQRQAAAGIQFALTCNDTFAEMLWAKVDRELDENARSF
jgi:hypothetical protein